jgi:hypothetical protein
MPFHAQRPTGPFAAVAMLVAAAGGLAWSLLRTNNHNMEKSPRLATAKIIRHRSTPLNKVPELATAKIISHKGLTEEFVQDNFEQIQCSDGHPAILLKHSNEGKLVLRSGTVLCIQGRLALARDMVIENGAELRCFQVLKTKSNVDLFYGKKCILEKGVRVLQDTFVRDDIVEYRREWTKCVIRFEHHKNMFSGGVSDCGIRGSGHKQMVCGGVFVAAWQPGQEDDDEQDDPTCWLREDASQQRPRLHRCRTLPFSTIPDQDSDHVEKWSRKPSLDDNDQASTEDIFGPCSEGRDCAVSVAAENADQGVQDRAVEADNPVRGDDAAEAETVADVATASQSKVNDPTDDQPDMQDIDSEGESSWDSYRDDPFRGLEYTRR